MAEPTSAFNEQGAQDALKRLALLHQINVEGALSENRDAFIFHILNKSIGVAVYDRATLWRFNGAKPSLLGVSGQSELDKRSELGALWRRVIANLENPKQAGPVTQKQITKSGRKDWEKLNKTIPGLRPLWLPMHSKGKLAGGLWVERWHENGWAESETRLMASLSMGYAASWDKFFKARKTAAPVRRIVGRVVLTLLLLAAAYALIFIKAPLRIVAPCEVAPKSPFVVTAPLNGVIAELDIRPNQAVQPGDMLFSYDKRVPKEELNIARQQARVISSTLERARLQAFESPEARAEVAILKLKLEQERIRQRLAEQNVALLEVFAERSGRVVVQEPDSWRGRPVVVGEKVLEIVDPDRTLLHIWLPEDDNVLFDRHKPIKVLLNAFPERDLEAALSFVDREVSESPKGEPRIKAEAEWRGRPEGVKMGLMGVAVLYGEDVPLGYWLARKPLFWLRRELGI